MKKKEKRMLVRSQKRFLPNWCHNNWRAGFSHSCSGPWPKHHDQDQETCPGSAFGCGLKAALSLFKWAVKMMSWAFNLVFVLWLCPTLFNILWVFCNIAQLQNTLPWESICPLSLVFALSHWNVLEQIFITNNDNLSKDKIFFKNC